MINGPILCRSRKQIHLYGDHFLTENQGILHNGTKLFNMRIKLFNETSNRTKFKISKYPPIRYNPLLYYQQGSVITTVTLGDDYPGYHWISK